MLRQRDSVWLHPSKTAWITYGWRWWADQIWSWVREHESIRCFNLNCSRYDHFFYSTSKPRGVNALCASVSAPISGITLRVYSTQPSVYLYSGNWLPPINGKENAHYEWRGGFALLAQNLPDACHHENFPNCTLDVGEEYDESLIYEFPSFRWKCNRTRFFILIDKN